MGHTFTDILIHAVFSTKHREPTISEATAKRLYPYIGGILRAENCSLLAVGGMPDHVHLLMNVHPSKAVAEVLRVVKSRSSGWIHQTFAEHADFAWQAGYGAFSVSQSNREWVMSYIDTQAEHHRTRTFQEEFLELLRRHAIEFDVRYVWD